MKCKFWGVRGSVAAPGSQTEQYGGNTSCIELRTKNNDLFILDAGTGIRKLGLRLLADGEPKHARIFLTHPHWDHIEGIPFFKPFYFKQFRFTIFGSPGNKYKTKDMLRHALFQPYFPVGLADLKADVSFQDIESDNFEVGSVRISILPLNHPCHTIAYKFQEDRKTFIYMTDNELFCPANIITPYEKIVEFCRGADVLIHDAMYTYDEWNNFKGWGHSAIPNALQLGMDAGVHGLIFFHHDPERTDKEEHLIIKECRRKIKKAKKEIVLEGAMEDHEFTI